MPLHLGMRIDEVVGVCGGGKEFGVSVSKCGDESGSAWCDVV